MSYLLHIVGFVIGIALFLYLLSLYEGMKERRKGPRRQEKAGGPMHVEPESIFHGCHCASAPIAYRPPKGIDVALDPDRNSDSDPGSARNPELPRPARGDYHSIPDSPTYPRA